MAVAIELAGKPVDPVALERLETAAARGASQRARELAQRMGGALS